MYPYFCATYRALVWNTPVIWPISGVSVQTVIAYCLVWARQLRKFQNSALPHHSKLSRIRQNASDRGYPATNGVFPSRNNKRGYVDPKGICLCFYRFDCMIRKIYEGQFLIKWLPRIGGRHKDDLALQHSAHPSVSSRSRPSLSCPQTGHRTLLRFIIAFTSLKNTNICLCLCYDYST